jgi:glycerol-3-phosphate dehydrogenase
VLNVEASAGEPPLINVFGGKITTYRRLSEHMLEKVEGLLGKKGASWTAGARLPGGDFAHDGFDAEVARLHRAHPFLEAGHAARLVRLYGTRAHAILGAAKSTADLGRHFGADVYEAEIRYLMQNEWARSADDVLWRRTKRGLRLTREQASMLEEFMREVQAT